MKFGSGENPERAFKALQEIFEAGSPVVELIVAAFIKTTVYEKGDLCDLLLVKIKQAYPLKLPQEPFLWEQCHELTEEPGSFPEKRKSVQLAIACENMESYVYMFTLPSILEYMRLVGQGWLRSRIGRDMMPAFELLRTTLASSRGLGTYGLPKDVTEKGEMLLGGLYKYMKQWHNALEPLTDQKGLYRLKDRLYAVEHVDRDCKIGNAKSCAVLESLLPECIRHTLGAIQNYRNRQDAKLLKRANAATANFELYKAAHGLNKGQDSVKQAVKKIVMWDGAGKFRDALQLNFPKPEPAPPDEVFLSAVNNFRVSHDDVKADHSDTSMIWNEISGGCLQGDSWKFKPASFQGTEYESSFAAVINGVVASQSATQVAVAQMREIGSFVSKLFAHINSMWDKLAENDKEVRRARAAQNRGDLVKSIDSNQNWEMAANLKHMLKSWMEEVDDEVIAAATLERVFMSLFDLHRDCTAIIKDVNEIRRIKYGVGHSALLDPVVDLHNRVIGQLFVMMVVFQSPDGPSPLNIPDSI